MKHPVDIHVGRRIRRARLRAGKTQQEVANILNITFQRVQKYETGYTRPPASRLWEFAQALDVPVAYFFDGLVSYLPDEEKVPAIVGPVVSKEVVSLIRIYRRMPKTVRVEFLNLATSLAQQDVKRLG